MSATKGTPEASETPETEDEEEQEEEGTGRSVWTALELLADGACGVLHAGRCHSRNLGRVTRQQHFAAAVEAAAAAGAQPVGAGSVDVVAPHQG